MLLLRPYAGGLSIVLVHTPSTLYFHFLKHAIALQLNTLLIRRCDFVALEKGDYRRVSSRFPVEHASLIAMAHGRVATDNLRMGLEQHAITRGFSPALREAIMSSVEPFDFRAGEIVYTYVPKSRFRN